MEILKLESEWEETDLYEFFAKKFNHIVQSTKKFPEIVRILNDISVLFDMVQPSQMADDEFALYELLCSAHSCFMTSVELGLQGLQAETNTTLRLCLESSAYAIFIKQKGDDVQKIWISRSGDDTSKKKCRDTFVFSRCKSSIVDRTLRTNIHQLYQQTIDMGAHPSLMGTSLNTSFSQQTQISTRITHKYLITDDTIQLALLKTIFDSGICALKIFAQVFYHATDNSGLSSQIDDLAQRAITLFRSTAV